VCDGTGSGAAAEHTGCLGPLPYSTSAQKR
jgi:hypothetical protein